MLLRDERLIALDCVIVSAKKAADVYEDAASIAQDDATTELFLRLSRRRDEMAASLEEPIRALGGLPSDPDVESETVGQVWRHLKAALSTDEREQLIAEAASLEDGLTSCIDGALAAELPDEIRALLEQYRKEVAVDRGRLGAPGG